MIKFVGVQVDVSNKTEGRSYTDSQGVPVLVHYDHRWVNQWVLHPLQQHVAQQVGESVRQWGTGLQALEASKHRAGGVLQVEGHCGQA